MAFIDGTKERIEAMTSLLQDESKSKADVLIELAETKMTLFKEEEELKKENVALETSNISLKEQLDKARRDNVTLVDRIQSERPPLAGIDINQEEEKKKAEAKEKELQYESYVRQYGREYAEHLIKKEK